MEVQIALAYGGLLRLERDGLERFLVTHTVHTYSLEVAVQVQLLDH